MGHGVKIRGKITLGHPQKLAKRREKVDLGTFSDLNHFLRRVKSSELFLRHPSTSVDVLQGLEGVWDDISPSNGLGTSRSGLLTLT
jgi:hypothetical protein